MAMNHEQAVRAGHKGGTEGYRRMSPEQKVAKMAAMRAARKPLPSAEERLLSKVRKTETCWLFEGGVLNEDGYGQIGTGKRSCKTTAHRFAWMLWRGPIPHGLGVLHECDVRNCINPAHLFLGTQLDNMRDMVKKKRYADFSGEANPRVKLTANQVREIRALRTQALNPRKFVTEASEKFGVKRTAIYRVLNGQSWSNVATPGAAK